EGSLGIITAAVLKLFPLPKERHTAFIALANVEAALEILALARLNSADAVSACEYMPRIGIDFALRHNHTTRDPLAEVHDHYLILELSASRADGSMAEMLEDTLSQAFDKALIEDATIANSDSQRQQIWLLREALVHGQANEGYSIKNDVAVPVSKIPTFLHRANQAVTEACPGIRPVGFGHLGDGNIHYNLSQPVDADADVFAARWHELTTLVNEIVIGLGGTFSAEHGIGLLKREALQRYKPPVEVDMMRRIKQSLDPQGIMNPGKLL
ncbi:MAG: FAD-binding oxidoreductase, partial [Alphaproteobacteria bacterium]